MWAQRGYGWDVSRHRFFLKFLKMIFTWSPKMRFNYWILRMFAIFECIQIPYDWFILSYGWYFIVMSIIEGKYLFLLSTYIIAWSTQVIVGFLMNQFLLTPNKKRVSSAVIFFYPMLYKFYCITVIRGFAMLYNLLYYVPFVRNKTEIYKRWKKEDGEFKTMVEDCYEFHDNVDHVFLEEWNVMKEKTMPNIMKDLASEHRKRTMSV
eukprot:Pgem_evm1s3930